VYLYRTSVYEICLLLCDEEEEKKMKLAMFGRVAQETRGLWMEFRFFLYLFLFFPSLFFVAVYLFFVAGLLPQETRCCSQPNAVYCTPKYMFPT
jgi:hypothetical protein